MGLASCLWLVQDALYSSLASGRRHLLTYMQEVLTKLLVEIDNGGDRLELYKAPLFLPQYLVYSHISQHIVRPGLCPCDCVAKMR